MNANVGMIDRIFRLIVGVVLVALPFASSFEIWANPVWTYGSVLVGLVLAVTAAVRFCPLYRILGICTTQR